MIHIEKIIKNHVKEKHKKAMQSHKEKNSHILHKRHKVFFILGHFIENPIESSVKVFAKRGKMFRQEFHFNMIVNFNFYKI